MAKAEGDIMSLTKNKDKKVRESTIKKEVQESLDEYHDMVVEMLIAKLQQKNKQNKSKVG